MNKALFSWLRSKFPDPPLKWEILPGDASFKSFFRIYYPNATYILMEAPPHKENLRAFMAIAHVFFEHQLKVPEILASDLNYGFVLMTDFSGPLLLDALSEDNADRLYTCAMDILLSLGKCPSPKNWPLGHLDHREILKEMMLFQEWCLNKLLNIPLKPYLVKILDDVYEHLLDVFTHQPQVTTHRDFHSRNLICLSEDPCLGVIDFQDACKGPLTYDLVSLLKDCYIAWPEKKVEQWLGYFHQQYAAQSPKDDVSYLTFKTWFDLTGMQRHLKILGIFSRLKLRDGKARYLHHMPGIVNYLLQVACEYPQMTQFRETFLQDILPRFQDFWLKNGIKGYIQVA